MEASPGKQGSRVSQILTGVISQVASLVPPPAVSGVAKYLEPYLSRLDSAISIEPTSPELSVAMKALVPFMSTELLNKICDLLLTLPRQTLVSSESDVGRTPGSSLKKRKRKHQNESAPLSELGRTILKAIESLSVTSLSDQQFPTSVIAQLAQLACLLVSTEMTLTLCSVLQQRPACSLAVSRQPFLYFLKESAHSQAHCDVAAVLLRVSEACRMWATDGILDSHPDLQSLYLDRLTGNRNYIRVYVVKSVHAKCCSQC